MVELSGKAAGKSTVRATLDVRRNLAVQFMNSAAHFARESGQIEGTPEGFAVYRANVLAAITLATMALEATINQYYLEAVEGPGKVLEPLDPKARKLMATMWDIVEDKRVQVLEKYQLALVLAEKPEFDKGSLPYQEAQYLVDLRNVLTHYKPEWESRQKTGKKLEKKLQPLFAPSPFAADGDAFFPTKCLSYGCARWAVNSSIAFIEEFTVRLGVPSILGSNVESLKV